MRGRQGTSEPGQPRGAERVLAHETRIGEEKSPAQQSRFFRWVRVSRPRSIADSTWMRQLAASGERPLWRWPGIPRPDFLHVFSRRGTGEALPEGPGGGVLSFPSFGGLVDLFSQVT